MAIPGKESENGVYEFPYMIKPPKQTRWEAFKSFLWNPNTKEVLGRTGKSWAQIILFYIIFYIVLAALFAICMAGLYATLDKDKPTYTDLNSLIGSNPGLGFRPIADRTSEGALIWYNSKNETTWRKWIKLLDEFLAEYDLSDPIKSKKFSAECSFKQPPKDDQACPVDVSSFGPCSPPFYGYNTLSPCVFLKLNRIYNWVPEYINSTDKLPAGIPTDVVERISLAKVNNETNRVWVSCEGEYDADKEHASASNFSYHPRGGGFPAYYYPFKHKKDAYLSPLVAVQIINPVGGVIINVECRAWAHNIEYVGGNPEQRRGSVHFEIMRDDNL